MESIILISLTLEELEQLIRNAVKQALDEWTGAQPKTTAKTDPEKLLTRQETADLLHVSVVTLRELEKRKELLPGRIGRRVLYKRSEVERMLMSDKTRMGRRR